MNSVRQCTRLGQLTLRRFSTNRPMKSNIDPESTDVYKALKKNQEIFQREDTVEEVFIKGGIKDVLIYRVVAAITAFGLVYDGVSVFRFVNM